MCRVWFVMLCSLGVACWPVCRLECVVVGECGEVDVCVFFVEC